MDGGEDGLVTEVLQLLLGTSDVAQMRRRAERLVGPASPNTRWRRQEGAGTFREHAVEHGLFSSSEDEDEEDRASSADSSELGSESDGLEDFANDEFSDYSSDEDDGAEGSEDEGAAGGVTGPGGAKQSTWQRPRWAASRGGRRPLRAARCVAGFTPRGEGGHSAPFAPLPCTPWPRAGHRARGRECSLYSCVDSLPNLGASWLTGRYRSGGRAQRRGRTCTLHPRTLGPSTAHR